MVSPGLLVVGFREGGDLPLGRLGEGGPKQVRGYDLRGRVFYCQKGQLKYGLWAYSEGHRRGCRLAAAEVFRADFFPVGGRFSGAGSIFSLVFLSGDGSTHRLRTMESARADARL